MPTQTVSTWTNIVLPDAPPEYNEPGPSGDPVPNNKTFLTLNIDQANVPADQTYAFAVEFRRAAWTDKIGVQHPAGEWLQAGGGGFNGGIIQLKNGGTTTINTLILPLSPIDSQGNPVLPYPDRVRVRVQSVSSAWLFPSIVLTMT